MQTKLLKKKIAHFSKKFIKETTQYNLSYVTTQRETTL